MDYLESHEGIAIYPDHEYELISIYNNTSGQSQDAMAVMNIYMRDLEVMKGVVSVSHQ